MDLTLIFGYYTSLISSDLSNFSIKNLELMYKMFFGCSSLTSDNLAKLNTQKVDNIGHLFYKFFKK
jgi:surface protein